MVLHKHPKAYSGANPGANPYLTFGILSNTVYVRVVAVGEVETFSLLRFSASSCPHCMYSICGTNFIHCTDIYRCLNKQFASWMRKRNVYVKCICKNQTMKNKKKKE